VEKFQDIAFEKEIPLTDHFLENGIYQLDFDLRTLFAHFRNHQTIDFVISGKVFPVTYRKDHAYFISLELKEMCQRLGLEAGARVRLIRRHSDFQRFYLSFPVQDQRLERVLNEFRMEADLPRFQASFDWVEESVLSNRLDQVWKKTAKPTNNSLDSLKDSLRYRFLHQVLEECDLVGLQGLQSVEHFPHQIRTVRKVLFDCAGRALLADEVGLGKTVEAGIVMREYLLRKQVHRILILTPASLTSQWQGELKGKFEFDFPVVDHPSQLEDSAHIIMSLDLAKSKFFSKKLLSQNFDLVIVDEAHKLKNRKTLNYRFVKALSSQFLLLLTATPIQNDLIELYNLVHLISPGSLGTMEQFRKRFIHPVNKKLPINPELLKRHLASHMIRNSRMETQLQLPPRRVVLKEVDPSPQELEVYNRLTAFVRENYYLVSRSAQGINQLTLMLLQKLAASSPWALRDSLDNLAQKEDLFHDIRLTLDEMARECHELATPTKFQITLKYLQEELKGEKVILFTQFRSTQKQLMKFLENHQLEVVDFHGEMTTKKKNKQIDKFRQDKQILVSTDCGAEGWNLQFARCMINFDLPWNPMKVEQRIGRIHRLGQTRDVTIINYCMKGTIEEHIVELLGQKIRLFERVVGELEMILGYMDSEWRKEENLEKKIMEIIVKHASPEEQRKELEKLGKGLLKASRAYEQVKKAQNVLLGDA